MLKFFDMTSTEQAMLAFPEQGVYKSSNFILPNLYFLFFYLSSWICRAMEPEYEAVTIVLNIIV